MSAGDNKAQADVQLQLDAAQRLVAELSAQLAARETQLAACNETLRQERQDRDSLRASLAVHQRMLAERDELLARVAEVEAARLERQTEYEAKREHAALLLRAIRVAKRLPSLVDVLGVVAAHGFQIEAAPHHGLCKDTWRGDVLLIGALRNFPRPRDGATRLHCAGMKGWVERITQLVVEDKANVEAVDRGGQTPLHWAARAGLFEVAQELVRRGAMVEAKDTNGRTPLIEACYYGHAEVTRFLLDKGAAIETKVDEDCTSLFLASQEGHTEVVKMLIAYGAVVDAPDNEGTTPHYFASQKGNSVAVRELLAHGANPNASANGGWTPLHGAALGSRPNHAEVTCQLLSQPATGVNARNSHGCNPLMLACSISRLKTATVLICHGADLTLLDNVGRSALSCSLSRSGADSKAITALLAACGAP